MVHGSPPRLRMKVFQGKMYTACQNTPMTLQGTMCYINLTNLNPLKRTALRTGQDVQLHP